MTTDELHFERIARSIDFLTKNFKKQPDLAEAARQAHLSPEHFQRIFTEWAGVSPKRFLQFLTVDFLRGRLAELPNLQAAADLAGLSAQSRVYDLFVTVEGVTPGEFRAGGAGLRIGWGIFESPFGAVFVAVAERGICSIQFFEAAEREQVLTNFQKKWPFAQLEKDEKAAASVAELLFQLKKPMRGQLNILAQGTNFQLKVWEALLQIPAGGVATYGQIAEKIGRPAAVRAVGTAVGANPVAALIPCHRVIRGDGQIGQYRWGEVRKMALLGCEMAKSVTRSFAP